MSSYVLQGCPAEALRSRPDSSAPLQLVRQLVHGGVHCRDALPVAHPLLFRSPLPSRPMSHGQLSACRRFLPFRRLPPVPSA
eukprot:3938096-Rhodomonas_salina.3